MTLEITRLSFITTAPSGLAPPLACNVLAADLHWDTYICNNTPPDPRHRMSAPVSYLTASFMCLQALGEVFLRRCQCELVSRL